MGRDPKSVHFDGLYSSKTPLLEVFFLDIAFIIASDRLKKALTKKKTDKQTNRHTDLSRSRGRLDPVFRHFKGLVPSLLNVFDRKSFSENMVFINKTFVFWGIKI